MEINIGKIKTHLTSSGYFTKGIRKWIEINGPLDKTDQIYIRILDENKREYELKIRS